MSKSPEQTGEIKRKGSKSSLFLLKHSSQPAAAESGSSVQKPVKVQGKYELKSIHEEIGLYDRKLAHTAKYEVFASEAAREAALAKLTAKRALLVRTAQKLVEDGIEFQPSDLPRSLRQTEGAALASAV